MSKRGLISKTSELSKNKQPNFKIDRRLEKTIHKEDIHMANKPTDRTSLPSRERQIKVKMRSCEMLIRRAELKQDAGHRGGWEGMGTLTHRWWGCRVGEALGEIVWPFHVKLSTEWT